ncbi:EAL domain-containing protein [Gellertiella hungarica]|uniref:cyclic-guanylate-specific phosphodiesterase n=1 Tax=Gellertiella hungarica TaxID=1572859 RepID=A0A7W6NLU3_9HYPH|nr:EAL domain-containing protein [Gellertiella hungarica]MBB4066293.1 sensor c-di-GMP phosphodiesterase-like protein [Gellertiella hungarica]
MRNPLGYFIDPERQRAFSAAAATIGFFVALGLFAGFYANTVDNIVDRFLNRALENLQAPVAAASKGFEALNAAPRNDRCSEELVERLRDASFLPDGINEFMLVNDGKVECTSTLGLLATPFELGTPSIDALPGGGRIYRFGVNLSALGHQGQYASIVQEGRFAAILPSPDMPGAAPSWLALEGLAWNAARHVPYRLFGQVDLFFDHQRTNPDGGHLATTRLLCTADGVLCATGSISLAELARNGLAWGLLALAFSALFGSFVASRFTAFLQRTFRLEARLMRNLVPDRIQLCYQPILDTRTRGITGCEVLARWKDLDGSIVYPDRFLPILEREKRMLEFTRMVVDKAWVELSTCLPPGQKLQVNINISPQNVPDPALPGLFDRFLQEPRRFTLAVELVETERMSFEDAEHLIQRLREKGIRTYIDDFGTGYSNLENLARLSVDAVKLDKSFALAPENSLMGEMLEFALKMAKAIGRSTVVEGVETPERFDQLLKLSVPVDYIQGYFIARPVDIRSFAAFLAQGNSWNNGAQQTQRRA